MERASSRRMRSLGAQLRKLPELKAYEPSLRLRGNGLYVLLATDGRYPLRKTPWLKLDVEPDASDLQILSAVGRAVNQYKEQKEREKLPVASGSLATLRRKALAELDGLKLTAKVTAQRQRRLDDLLQYLEARGLEVSEDSLLGYIRTHPRQERGRRDAETAARLLLGVAKNRALVIPRSERWKAPPPKKSAPLDDGVVIEAVLRMIELYPEGGWPTAMVALTGARGAMVMSCELLHHSVPVEIGTYIRCRDDKRGRSRPSNLCPSWKALLLALPSGYIETPPELFKEAARPFDRPPTTEEQLASEKRMVYVSNKLKRLLSEDDRRLLDLRQLRHHRARALLDADISLLRVAELLSTSPDMLVKTYSDHHRFRAADDVKRLFG